MPVLAGAAEANVKETLAACEAYAGMGARAVAIVSPFYYRLAPESVYAYFAEIARHSPIDLTLYNIPMFASPIDVPTIRRLAEFPRIIGIKDSSGDVAFMMRMIAAVRPAAAGLRLPDGMGSRAGPMLMIGCDGGTNATSNAVPEVTRAHLRPFARRKVRRGHALAVPHAGAVRRHAVPVRISRWVPRGRRDARIPLRPRPAAPDAASGRKTAPR